jgi:hypothetical protein
MKAQIQVKPEKKVKAVFAELEAAGHLYSPLEQALYVLKYKLLNLARVLSRPAAA